MDNSLQLIGDNKKVRYIKKVAHLAPQIRYLYKAFRTTIIANLSH